MMGEAGSLFPLNVSVFSAWRVMKEISLDKAGWGFARCGYVLLHYLLRKGRAKVKVKAKYSLIP